MKAQSLIVKALLNTTISCNWMIILMKVINNCTYKALESTLPTCRIYFHSFTDIIFKPPKIKTILKKSPIKITNAVGGNSKQNSHKELQKVSIPNHLLT